MIKEHPLDSLAWNSLTTKHRHLGIIGEKAAIYDPQVFAFAAIKEDSPEAWSELAELIPPNVPKYIQYKPPENNKDWTTLHEATGDQMILEKHAVFQETEFETLTVDDVPQMFALMKLTDATKFEPRMIETGKYIGYKVDERLVAMGGERFQVEGFVEVAAVGTHPDYRRRGLGRAITGSLANDILERGDTPFLHCWANNESAYRLYKRMGFETRVTFTVHVIMKKGS
jgi:predicted GNAT family acetyltransferase